MSLRYLFRTRSGSARGASWGPLAFVVGGLLAASPSAQGADAANRADYRIEARLEGETKVLDGELWLTWTNGSTDPVSDLWFHLYLNAFSNNRSTHLAEARGKLGEHTVESGWGWSRVESIELLGEAREDLFPSFTYRRPDDGREEDRTVFSVDLPRAVAPGESIELHLTWQAQLPRVRRRTGFKDDFLLVAQWFPKLGVYESGRGWNSHQFHANTEFYSDYGTYDVTLDLPAEYKDKAFGSGVTHGEVVGGRWIATCRAPSALDRDREDALGKQRLVHDFTWTGDPRFVVENYTFRFAEWAERFPDEVERAREAFGPDVEVGLRNVDVTVLIHPERRRQADRHFQATCAALFFYGLWFGEYPYQHVTVVDPPWGGRAAGGMEYPTLFTCGTRLFSTKDMYVPESVTVHEAGHQFWYGLVGNNEFEAAWLDEGFNSYTDSEVLARVYGPRRETTDFARLPIDGRAVGGAPGGGRFADALSGRSISIPVPILGAVDLTPIPASGFLDLWRAQPALTFVPEWTDPRWDDRARYLRDANTDPIDTRAWEYVDRSSYRSNSYPHPAVALRSLPAIVGEAAFLRGMRHYATEWRYAHPYPDDFFAAFQEGAEVDVDWYFREVFRGTGTVDWSVAVQQERRTDPLGYFQSEGGEFRERPEPSVDDETENPWVYEVDIRRAGELRLPVSIRLGFEDGSTEEMAWTREDQASRAWMRVERTSDTKLVSVVIDPERRYYLDTDMSNNQWYDATESITGWRYGERVLAQYQRYFHWIAGLGG